MDKKVARFESRYDFIVRLFLLQIIVLVTTLSLNILIFFGANFSFNGLTSAILWNDVALHLGYGLLLGSFCFRYLYLREQWFRQQNSELNARVQAMQARIHPHFCLIV